MSESSPLFPPPPPIPPRTGSSAVLKVVSIGFLGFCLLIPLALVWALVAERAARRDEVVKEITASVGGQQTVGGIAIDLPYDVVERQPDSSLRTVTRVAHAFPDTLAITARVVPEVRYRSQYGVTIYRATVTMTGTITPPDLARLGAEATMVHWDRAAVTVEIPDLRGTVAVAPLKFGDRSVTLEPLDSPSQVFRSGIRGLTPLAPDTTTPIPFSLELTIAGSEALRFVPAGKATEVAIASSWPSPGFHGAFLPTSKSISADGFKAAWQVSYLARSFPNAWLDANTNQSTLATQRETALFGVTLVQGVDHYQQAERAVKYGLLFVLLTFTVFLLWELLRNLRLHPVQYLLIGAALVVFYLLLLSLAEHMRFGYAYAIAAAATVALVAAYSGSVLREGPRGAVGVAAWLSAAYGVLFVLLQLEDLALLVGSVFVFLVLAAVMFLTRRIEWSDMRAAA
jgi:inner membrane protein